MTSADRLKRLARAQRALADAAKAESIAAKARFEKSRAQADEILGALNETNALHGFAVSSMAETLRRNGRTTERLRRVADERNHNHGRQEHAAEVLADRADAAATAERRKAERKYLETLVSTPGRSRRRPPP